MALEITDFTDFTYQLAPAARPDLIAQSQCARRSPSRSVERPLARARDGSRNHWLHW